MAEKRKKEDLQKEFSKLMDQAKDKLRKFGREVGVFAEKSEKGILKASKTGKIQLDIMGLKMRKEKLYYDIGKKTVSLNAKNKINVPELDAYWKKIRKIETDIRNNKRHLSGVRKES